MSKVYIVQNPMRRDRKSGELISSFDLTPARQYGSLEVLLRSGPVLLDPVPATERLWEKLRDFTSRDKLLCLGDPVAIAAAASIVGQVNGGIIPLLVWDRHTKQYLEINVDVNQHGTDTEGPSTGELREFFSGGSGSGHTRHP